MKVELIPLTSDDREQFILDNQEAFNFGAMEEYGMRDNHLEEDGNIISRKTIEECIDGGEAYRIVCENKKVGGVIVKVKGKKGSLEILFVSPNVHSKGIGYATWCEIEKMYPDVEL